MLSEEQLLLHELTRGLDLVRQRRAPLMLVVLGLVSAEELRERLGEAQYELLLDSLKTCAEKVTRRLDDRVLVYPERGEMVLMLPDIGVDSAEAFTERLLEALESLPAGESTASQPEWWLGTAVFPDEAAGSKRLYARAKDRAGKTTAVP